MDIVLIAAMSANRVIGKDGRTPWHIPEELAFFKTTTMGHPLIMGRNTFESLLFPLPGRRNIVLSREPSYHAEGAEIVSTLERALELCNGADIVFVIGGAQIFSLAMPLATGILLSVLDRAVDGDTTFPVISPLEFREISRTHYTGTENFNVVTYRRL
ncbi:MAG: dihydrofolate reductase [Desulfobulbaceae bacterium]|nr:MAG: dihydrofolate reductase [Desulfobulbaceae bacterium]